MKTDRGRDVEKKQSGCQSAKEKELITKVSFGDKKAFEMLYNIYYSRLYRFISRITAGEYIDETINDVMFVVWKKAETFNSTCLPSTWIFGIAYKKALQSLRQSKHHIEESLNDTDLSTQQFGKPDSGINQYEISNFLGKAFETLSPEQRAVVELTFFNGLSYKEIAVLMDCSENTVKTRMYYSREKLTKALKKMEEK